MPILPETRHVCPLHGPMAWRFRHVAGRGLFEDGIACVQACSGHLLEIPCDAASAIFDVSDESEVGDVVAPSGMDVVGPSGMDVVAPSDMGDVVAPSGMELVAPSDMDDVVAPSDMDGVVASAEAEDLATLWNIVNEHDDITTLLNIARGWEWKKSWLLYA